jgi:hypothetical protein
MLKAKSNLVRKKLEKQMPITIEKTDIIPLSNYSWKGSFARIKSNKKALSERGWAPLNYNLLLHPEIATTKPRSTEENATPTNPADSSLMRGIPTHLLDPSDINLSSTRTLGVLDRLLTFESREDSKERRKRAREEGEDLAEILKKAKRFTAGVAFQINPQIANKEYAEMAKDKKEMTVAAEAKKTSDAQERRAQLHRKVHSLLASGKDHTAWNSTELGVMLQYYKVANDPGMASDVAGRRAQWHERRERIPEPLLPIEEIDAILGPSEATVNQ